MQKPVDRIRSEFGFTDLVSFEEGIKRTVEHYLEHLLEIAAEQQIGDPFDYTAEDTFIALLNEMNARRGAAVRGCAIPALLRAPQGSGGGWDRGG